MISRGLFVLALLLLTGPAATPMSARAQQMAAPNILLIIADDMGIDASPCYELGTIKPDMPVLEAHRSQAGVPDQRFFLWERPPHSTRTRTPTELQTAVFPNQFTIWPNLRMC